MSFNESSGGAQIVEKTEDYTAYFITSFEGLTNIEMNDPSWCSTNRRDLKSESNENMCFIRYKFKSGLKFRVTIYFGPKVNKRGIYSIAYGGILKKYPGYRVTPWYYHNDLRTRGSGIKLFDIIYRDADTGTHPYINNYYKKINEFINSEVSKIDKEKLKKLVSRIIKNKWGSRFLNLNTDNEIEDLGKNLIIKLKYPGGGQYEIEKLDDKYYIMERNGFSKDGVNFILEKNGNIDPMSYILDSRSDGIIPKRFRGEMNIKYLIIYGYLSQYNKPDYDEFIHYIEETKIFKRINTKEIKYGYLKIEAEFKNFSICIDGSR